MRECRASLAGNARATLIRAVVSATLILIGAALPGAEAFACRTLAEAPHSRWSVSVRAGRSWLTTPCGDRFFSIGVNVLNGGAPPVAGRPGYYWPALYPNRDTWLGILHRRLHGWGFNTAGAWSLGPEDLGLPATPNLDLGRLAQFHWFDPFEPGTEQRMREWAERLVRPYRGTASRIGYFPDNEVGWWNGALFTYFMKKPPANHTKQRLVGLLREHYADDWERFTSDFAPPPGVTSFQSLLETSGGPTRLRPGGTGIQAIRRWTGLVAERYYRLVRESLRLADPEALVFSDRLPIYYDPDAVRVMAPYIDVVATNYNLDSPDGWAARYFFDGLRTLTGSKPILISEWFFAANENRTGNRNYGHLMTVGTQAERARGAAAAAEGFARDPNIVGFHWFQYYDHPRGGRGDGEDYNFGLVDIRDRPYAGLVAALARVHRRAVDLHGDTRRPASAAAYAIPAAIIDPDDRSLADWPKEPALLPRLATSPSEIAFGELYLAWSRAGLYLAVIGMDYYDPHLLALEGEFPLGEAFQIEWGLDAGRGARRFALYIVPPEVLPEKGAPMFRPRLCRRDGDACRPVPGATATYFGSDQPRITAEIFLPWKAVGTDAPPATGRLKLELAATAFHRSRWMSTSGLPPAAAMTNSARWVVVPLGVRAPPRSHSGR
jgi:hypothetical protein